MGKDPEESAVRKKVEPSLLDQWAAAVARWKVTSFKDAVVDAVVDVVVDAVPWKGEFTPTAIEPSHHDDDDDDDRESVSAVERVQASAQETSQYMKQSEVESRITDGAFFDRGRKHQKKH